MDDKKNMNNKSKNKQLNFNLKLNDTKEEDIKLSYKDRYLFKSYNNYYRKNRSEELTNLKSMLEKFEDKIFGGSSNLMNEFVFYPPLFQIKPVKGEERDQAAINAMSEYLKEQSFIEKIVEYIELYAEKFKNKDSFHNLLIEYFSESGLNQKELSERANVSYTTLNKILNNRKNLDNISMNYIIKLCLAMKLSIDETQKLLLLSGYVLTGKDDRERYIRLAIKDNLGVVKTNLYLDENNLPLL